MSPQPQDPRPGRSDRPGLGVGGAPDQNWRWAVLVLFALVAAAFILPGVFSHQPKTQLTYTQYLTDVSGHQVKSADVSNDTGVITGQLSDGTNYTVSGPEPAIPADVAQMRADGVKLSFHTQ
ncbi:MAG TPA: ATP-dependent metallopeptidase FtsH/Yme1/Tma family protein, partial [Acidimicrobiales bacterium]|nr:ATP-dependent metallopeptidase FtsH/Yme1/Tma family protein [Acidimicrobiales bacterium]